MRSRKMRCQLQRFPTSLTRWSHQTSPSVYLQCMNLRGSVHPRSTVSLSSFLTTANKQRHESPPHEDPGYYAMSPDHLDRRYGRRQFVPEDSAIALGLIGAPSLDALAPLLRHADPWIRINAAYAIGEIGESVPGDIADQVGALLEDDLQQVVRAAADALCWLPYSDASLERISRHFNESRSDWQEAAMGEPNLGRKMDL